MIDKDITCEDWKQRCTNLAYKSDTDRMEREKWIQRYDKLFETLLILKEHGHLDAKEFDSVSEHLDKSTFR